MKILFLTDNFPPEVNAPATRTFEHCKEWVKEGIEVTVITCNPNFPQGKVYEGYKNKIIPQRELIEGIKVIRVWSYITRNEGFFKRTLDYISYSLSAFIVGLFIKTDLIVATSPQFFTAISGFWLAFFKRKKWVFELRDLWPDSIRSVTSMNSQWILNLLEKIELRLYKNANLIVAVTDAFKKNLIQRGIDAKKITVITNGCNLELFNPQVDASDLRSKLNLHDKIVVSYIGTHGLAHDLELYVSNLNKIENNNIEFLFIGDGANKKLLVQRAKELNLDNVQFLDPVPKSEIVKYWALADFALIPLKQDDTFKTVIPSKIFEAAAMRKPILLGVDGQAREIMEEYDAGLFFEPGNFDDFNVKLNRLIEEPELKDKIKNNCSKLAEAYNRQTLAKTMLDHLKALV
ncbi:glycosyltransferase family 4 protein [Marivirga salinae]|uniref:Glycosyltransferase family 4 protein n=1 Tax=Marivirga salinarum TaxID=3059078 RepID=A0AA51RBN6_9BACT|nr:glycosyltransferase family 4 protein [Marivirga sp. BDSF4-3]WMN12466.1 glycosyltransferase family 4 protein [Marivirga sp. BDSF4-3]